MATQTLLSVFTEKYSKIERRILNHVVITANGCIDQAIAQWDTGATGTCISEETVAKYKLVPVGKIRSKTPSGSCDMNVYLIDLILNNEIIFRNAEHNFLSEYHHKNMQIIKMCLMKPQLQKNKKRDWIMFYSSLFFYCIILNPKIPCHWHVYIDYL